MIKKKKVSLLTLTLILCLVLPAMSTAPEADYTRAMNDIYANQADFVISKELAWSDDFDDGNIDGWSVYGYTTELPNWPSRPGNFTAEDYTMRATGENWSEAWRTSDVAYGEWAFDVYCVDTLHNRSYIAFVSGSPPTVPDTYPHIIPFEYGIIPVVGQYLSYDNAFLLYYRSTVDIHTIFIGEYDVEDASGWWHINVTRDFDGFFKVYFNDTLGITVRDRNHLTSDLFTFTAEAGYALDNIVVVRYPDRDGPVIGYPFRHPVAPNSTQSVSVNVNVTDVSGVDTVILSYDHGTNAFNITMTLDGSDYVGTIPALPNGTDVQYRVYANDTIGNWNVSGINSYTVTDLPQTTPTLTTTSTPPPIDIALIAIGGGVAIAVIVLAIVILRRR